jgi:hypothetical protein
VAVRFIRMNGHIGSSIEIKQQLTIWTNGERSRMRLGQLPASHRSMID